MRPEEVSDTWGVAFVFPFSSCNNLGSCFPKCGPQTGLGVTHHRCVGPQGGWMQRELPEKPLHPGAVCNVRFPVTL